MVQPPNYVVERTNDTENLELSHRGDESTSENLVPTEIRPGLKFGKYYTIRGNE